MKIDRRNLLLKATAALALPVTAFANEEPKQASTLRFELPKLPWEQGALDPVLSSRTVGVHYGKHHAAYVDNLNKILATTPTTSGSLVELIDETVGRPDRIAVFNNAAQTWNHTFFWQSLAPQAGGTPGGDVLALINGSFGSFGEFRKAFLAASASQFGSGWVWLVFDKTTKKVGLQKSGNAETPLTSKGLVPLLVLDVWEHAYYLDYENRRGEYAAAVFDKLLNWRFVERNLASL